MVFLFVTALAAVSVSAAEELKMGPAEMEGIAKILHSSKPAPDLRCSVKVSERREQRTYLSGTKWIEYLEVEFTNSSAMAARTTKAVFPVGSLLRRKEVLSPVSRRPAEELVLEADDQLNHVLTVQHDGQGQLLWIEIHNSLMINPCRPK